MVLTVPESFLCPINQTMMADPVMDPDGNSYERAAIQEWLAQSPTSPVTRAPLRPAELTPNRALKAAIDDWVAQNGPDAATFLAAAGSGTGATTTAEAVRAMQARAGAAASTTTFPSTAKEGAGAATTPFLALASVKTPRGSRVPLDVCCVIDVSGSMATEATVQKKAGVNEKSGLGLLDVVKHAVRTVSNILGKDDRMSIVAFSDRAREVLALTGMTKAGRDKALKRLEALDTGGSTNLWAGLETGLDGMRQLGKTESSAGRQRTVLLLTDGQPNIVPPRGHIPMLQRYMADHEGLACSIHTFGFGYNIDEELLSALSLEGHGTYNFIPDAGMVGTVFIHTLSNALVAMDHTATLNVELASGIRGDATSPCPTAPATMTSWGAAIRLDQVQYGQAKEVVLQLEAPAGMAPADRLGAVVGTLRLASGEELTADISLDPAAIAAPQFRAEFVRLLAGGKGALEEGLAPFVRRLKAAIAAGTADAAGADYLTGLLADCEGQVAAAVSRDDWWAKWGRRYLPSLGRAHQLQQCNNFKDPGLQGFGGALFGGLRDEADAVFCKLPPPKPKKRTYSAPQPTNMRMYHSRSSGCFEGSCKVRMADGSTRRVDAVRKGDAVRTPGGGSARVVCAVRIRAKGTTSPMVVLPGGLSLTPYHPIRVGGAWKFPLNVAPVVERPLDQVTTFVLDRAHIMLIDGTECVTLGHAFTADVVRHPFFGSQRVIVDLQKKTGWRDGLVRLEHDSFVRKNGLIARIA